MNNKIERIWLSHTGLEILERCPRCFWLYYNRGIKQPEGIVSRLANRFDIILKKYFNTFRKTGKLPPMISGKMEGKLQSPFQEKYFVTIDKKYGFFGKLDECLVNNEGELIPIDFKTSSSDPREKEILSAYQSQIDSYIFILQQNHRKTAGFAYLLYIYPDASQELHHGFPMVIHIAKLIGNPQNTAKKISQAIKVLEAKIPASSPQCPFCNWYETIKAELRGKKFAKNPTLAKKPSIQNLELDLG